MKKIIVILLVLVITTSCSGMKKSGDNFTVHAESFNIVGFQLPTEAYSKAHSMVPAGGQIHTVSSGPTDWTSFFGVLNQILGFNYTEISGKGGK